MHCGFLVIMSLTKRQIVLAHRLTKTSVSKVSSTNLFLEFVQICSNIHQLSTGYRRQRLTFWRRPIPLVLVRVEAYGRFLSASWHWFFAFLCILTGNGPYRNLKHQTEMWVLAIAKAVKVVYTETTQSFPKFLALECNTCKGYWHY